MAASSDMVNGDTIGPYTILGKLGAGGMGEVYRARDSRLGRDIALKVLPAEVTQEPGRLERFDREARAIAALNHPHIVTIHSTEEADGIRFLTMELVDGCTLSDLIVPGGMAVARFLDIATPLADALTAAHQKQITHRDLKPGNVMVSRDGRVKVLDFGLARVAGGDAAEQAMIATQAPITHQGTIVGTMPYMSPEQVEGRTPDPRSDLFSLGVIFYELLKGERPFTGASSPSLMSAILRDTPPPIGATRRDVPEAIERLVFRLLEKRPEDRVQTARDVFNELRYARGRVASSSAPAAARQPGAGTHVLWIAVLPFEARSSDDETRALADGLTDDITNGLSRFNYLRVMSRVAAGRLAKVASSAPTPDGQPTPRFTIEGTVRKTGSTIRVGVQAVDTHTGTNLWTETLDREASAGTLAVQDALTGRIVATVGDHSGVLARAMAKSLADTPVDTLDVAGLAVRIHAYVEHFAPEEHLALRGAAERLVEREPKNGEAWALLSALYEHEHSHGLNPLPDSRQRQRAAAERAIVLDPRSQTAWMTLVGANLMSRDIHGLRVAVERAVGINPLNADLTAVCAIFLAVAGDEQRAVELTRQAAANKPQHPGWYHLPTFYALYFHGEYDEALREAKLINVPMLPFSHLAVAAAAGQLGSAADSELALRALRTHAPALIDPERVREKWMTWFIDDARADLLTEGFRKAIALQTEGEPRTRSTSLSSGAAMRGLWVAVLPFQARTDDEESRSLADGLTDDITTGLSRFSYLRVVSRAAAERFAKLPSSTPVPDGQPSPRFALEGTVRTAGTTFRVGVRVVDTQSGANLWAENFDRDRSAGSFVVQDEITGRIVATVGDQTGVLSKAIVATIRDVTVEQLAIEELSIRFSHYSEQMRPEEHASLRDAVERYVERNPTSAAAWTLLSRLTDQEHSHGINPQPGSLARQRRAADRAIELDPRHQQAWTALAAACLYARDLPGLRGAVERAVEINPLNADLVAHCALLLSCMSDDEAAMALVRRSLTNKPQHPGWYHFIPFNYHYHRGEFDEALREGRRINMPMLPLSHYSVAAAAGHLGLAVDARLALDGLRAISPSLADASHARQAWAVWMSDPAATERYLEGFEKALALGQQV